MSILPVLSSRLRRLRQRHALTQEAFAEVAGLSYKFYQQIEAGRKKQVWLETVERLAAAYGLEAWQLLAPDDPSHTVISPAASAKSAQHRPHAAPQIRHAAVAEEKARYGAKPKAKPATKAAKKTR
jgi:transcriptional regulator with XRE-family HTH domain